MDGAESPAAAGSPEEGAAPPAGRKTPEGGASAEAARRKKARKPPAPVYRTPPEGHREALERQLRVDFGWQMDRDRQVRFPLPDHRNWQRVRFSGLEHFSGFRYEGERSTFAAAFTLPLPPGQVNADACLRAFEKEAREQLADYGGHFGAGTDRALRIRGVEAKVRSADGELSVFFSHVDFSAAWVALPAYEDGCLVYAVAVLWEDGPELPRAVRDRWAREGFRGLRALTPKLPLRK